MAYATPEQYTTYTGQAAPAGLDLLLIRAARIVDQALLAAVYDTEDEDVVAALRDATCEQAATWVAVGEDGTGALGEYANVSIGSVSLGRAQSGGAGGGGSAATRLAPQAWAILQQAGLTGHEPRTCC
jgi:hypothetical protein